MWIWLTVAGAAFSIFVALYVYRWMESVKDLTRQAAEAETATRATDARLLELIREKLRRDAAARQLEELTTLIRTRGL